MRRPPIAVADLMTPDPITLSARATIKRALEVMGASGIRHLPIVDARRRLIGVVSQRDLLAAASAGDTRRTLSAIMRSDVVAVTPGTPAHEAAYLILRHAIGCVPVTNRSGRLLGIATDTDFVRVAYEALGGRVPADEIESEE